MSERFEMRVSEDLLARLDAARGDAPRAAFVKRALEQKLDGLLSPQVFIPGGVVPARGSVVVMSPEADAVLERQFYDGNPLAAVEEREPSSGCPECGGDMRERDPLSRVRVCADCGLTERP